MKRQLYMGGGITEDDFMELVAELREAGFSQQEAIEEARKRLSESKAEGGIMNIVPREPAILGGIKKAIKKVGKTVGKIAKSDIGKAALLAGGAYYLGGGQIPGLMKGSSRFGFLPYMKYGSSSGTGFGLSNILPNILNTVGATGAAEKLGGAAVGEGIKGNIGKLATLGAVSTFLTKTLGMPPEQAEAELARDPSTYLRQYYTNLNPNASEEEISTFVANNMSEYAVGGRVGFAEGDPLPPDPTQPVNPFKPKPIGPVLPNKEMASYGYNEAMSDTFDMFLDMKKKGLIPPTMEFDEFLQEVVPEMGSKKIEETRGIAALGGRMGFDQGTKLGTGLMSLTDETIDIPMEDTQEAPSILDKFDDDDSDKVAIITYDEFGNQRLKLVPKSEVMPEGVLDSGRIMKAKGDTASMNAMQAAGIEGLPIRQNQAGVKELDLRETGGFIQPVGIKEKEDDIPAMLSNNEFVFTADAVRGMGDGNVNVGAQRMYDMMKKLEAGGRV